MSYAQINKVVGAIPSKNKFGEEGFIITALCDQVEMSAWTKNKDDFAVGDIVLTYFFDQWNKSCFKQIKHIVLDNIHDKE